MSEIRIYKILTVILGIGLFSAIIMTGFIHDRYKEQKIYTSILSENYINNYQVRFAHYLKSLDSSELRESKLIETKVDIYRIIEDITISKFYYDIAEDINYRNSSRGMLYKTLLNQYVVVLKEYIALKEDGNYDSFKYDIIKIMDDILLIGNWLLENNSSVEHGERFVHSDEQFYKEVYPFLCEEIKLESDFHRSLMVDD